MLVKRINDVKQETVTGADVSGARIQWLLGETSGAPNFYLRLIELEPGGYTPYHNHPWEHEIVFLEGSGRINTEAGPIPVEKDKFALVPGNETHQFENTGATPLKFLCLIPKEGK